MADTSADSMGVLVPESLINKRHILRWRSGDRVIEQDVCVISIDRPDLFPTTPLWRRCDLGGCVLFVSRPAS